MNMTLHNDRLIEREHVQKNNETYSTIFALTESGYTYIYLRIARLSTVFFFSMLAIWSFTRSNHMFCLLYAKVNHLGRQKKNEGLSSVLLHKLDQSNKSIIITDTHENTHKNESTHDHNQQNAWTERLRWRVVSRRVGIFDSVRFEIWHRMNIFYLPSSSIPQHTHTHIKQQHVSKYDCTQIHHR